MPPALLRLTLCLAFLLITGGRLAAQPPLVIETDPLTPAEQQTKFHLPEGFEIELVASEPMISKPINLNFDHRGRLYLTQSVEYPIPVQGEEARDAVMVLEDTDGDGRYDRANRFVDGLNIPIGVAPIPGGVIVHSLPNILRCDDTDGDGQIDQRRVLLGPFGQVDTHGNNNGFTRWIDGWMYACHGYRNQSTISGTDGHQITMTSGNTYRFRIDGSRVENHTFGQVNPFGLSFTPRGDAFTADCHTKPAYMLLRGAYYPSFGAPHDGLGFGPELMDHLHGSTAIGGIVYYAANHFPPEYRDTLFIGNPVTNRINHDRFELHGSTYRAIEQPDFLVCDDPWFRPVDIQLGPDGALYVADFYNAVIGHYEVPLDHPRRDRERGRIWRIVYRGSDSDPQAAPHVPNLSGDDLDALWARLADPNLSVRTMATNRIVDAHGMFALAPMRERLLAPCQPEQRAHGLWIVYRLEGLDEALARKLADDRSPLVRTHLVKALAETTHWSNNTAWMAELVREAMGDEDPFVRRAAADALGRHTQSEHLSLLLKMWQQAPSDDRSLIHTIRMALRDHLLVPELHDAVRQLARADDDNLRRLMDVALGARTPEVAMLVLDGLQTGRHEAAREGEFINFAARYLPEPRLPELVELAGSLDVADVDPMRQLGVVGNLSLGYQERGMELAEPIRDWAARLADRLLSANETEHVREGIALVRQLQLTALFDPLADLVRNVSTDRETRNAAMEASLAVDEGRALRLLGDVIADASRPTAVRHSAASVLATLNRPAVRELLLEQLPTAPAEVAQVIAQGLARSRPGGEALLEAIAAGKASPRLLQDAAIQNALREAQVLRVEARISQLTAELPPLDAAIAELIQQRRAGFAAAQPNVAGAREMFDKHCGVCHELAGQGNKVGPQLDGVGNRGLDRLLEDVLDPNRTLDPNFRSTLISTVDGRVLSGLVQQDEGQTVVLIDEQGKEIRLSKADIDQQRVSRFSAMPANLAQSVPENELYAVLAFLLQQRQAGPTGAGSQ
ncbi:MAG: PVC-type heme-binding CxxCH protein [Pirellulales bacterium]